MSPTPSLLQIPWISRGWTLAILPDAEVRNGLLQSLPMRAPEQRASVATSLAQTPLNLFATVTAAKGVGGLQLSCEIKGTKIEAVQRY